MTKKLDKKIKHQENCKVDYEVVETMLSLNEIADKNEKVRKIVFAANDILTEICQNADRIKIDMVDELNDEHKILITKGSFQEFVKLGHQVAYGKISDELHDNLLEQQMKSSYLMTLRKSFIDNYVLSNKDVEIPEKESVELPNAEEHSANDAFNDILKQGIEIRHYINSVLWPAFRQLSNAAEFVSGFELTAIDFKNLVDWEHYKEGGYPNEDSKPKLWSIFNKFDYAFRLMQKYEFPQNELLLKKFGLSVNAYTPHATRNAFSSTADRFIDYDIYMPKTKEQRVQLGMLECEAIIELTSKNIGVYDIETRVIRFICNEDEFFKPIGGKEKLLKRYNVPDNFSELLAFDKTSIQYLTDEIKLLHESIIYDECLNGIPSESVRILDDEERAIVGNYYRLEDNE